MNDPFYPNNPNMGFPQYGNPLTPNLMPNYVTPAPVPPRNLQCEQYNKVEAFARINQEYDGLCVYDSQGRKHILLNAKICRFQHIMPDSLYQVAPFYAISFEGVTQPLILKETDYDSNRTLLNEVARHCGQQINMVLKANQVAELLRNFFASISSPESTIPFYTGWSYENDAWSFRLERGSTHGTSPLDIPTVLNTPNESKTIIVRLGSTAEDAFATLMEEITPPKRDILCLWIHASALYSLLKRNGFPLPIGLTIQYQDARTCSYLKMLLEWYGDHAISLNETPARFLQLLAERKDQPLLIENQLDTRKNTDSLLQAMHTDTIQTTLKDGQSVSFQALPTVLSSSASPFTFTSHLMVLDLESEDFQDTDFSQLKKAGEYLQTYLKHFIEYVEHNVGLLNGCLSDGMDIAYKRPCCKDGLPSAFVETLGCLIGVSQMINAFFTHKFLGENLSKRLDSLLSDNWISTVEDMLVNASVYDAGSTDLTALFRHKASEMIQAGQFDIRRMRDADAASDCSDGKEGIIYTDSCYNYLTRSSFNAIVKECTPHRTAMIAALQEQGQLLGNKTNASTVQTRIFLANSGRPTAPVSVYKFDSRFLGVPEPAMQTSVQNSESDFKLQLGKASDGSPIEWAGGDNKHLLITGRSGCGKSVMLQKLIIQLAEQNVRTIIFDNTGDFTNEDIYHPAGWPIQDAELYDVKNGGYNVLPLCPIYDDESQNHIIERFLTAMDAICDFGPVQKNSLQGVVQFAFNQNNVSTLKEIIPLISTFSFMKTKFLEISNVLPEGKQLFDWKLDVPGTTIVQLDKEYTIEQRAILTELLLSTICNLREHSSLKKFPPVVLIFDECQYLRTGPKTRINFLLRAARKYNLNGWFSTQYIPNSSMRATLGEAATRLIFRPNSSDLATIAKNLRLTTGSSLKDTEMLLNHLKRGEFLYATDFKVIHTFPDE